VTRLSEIGRWGLALAPAAALLFAQPLSAAAPRTAVVVVDKMHFGAIPSALRVGDMIVWDNRDIFRHSATAKNGSFDVDLPAKSKARMVLKTAGTFAFTCKYHPGMRGTLIVAKR
jgi:plastocyanin